MGPTLALLTKPAGVLHCVVGKTEKNGREGQCDVPRSSSSRRVNLVRVP